MFKSFNLVWAKIEAGYGTDPTPTSLLNGILTGPVTIDPTYRKLDRLNVKSFLGNRPAINIGETVMVSFETELKGSGVAGTIPEIGVLLQGCAMAHTNTPVISDVFVPDDNIDGPSITLYVQQHDHKYVVLGARGTWSADLTAGAFAKIKWEFTGLYVDPTDNAIPVNTVYNATVPPIVKEATFTLGAFAGVISSFKLTYGNVIAKRPDANAATGFLAHFISDRKITVQIDPEAPALAAFNPLALMQANTEQTLAITVGTVPGNICAFTFPKVVFDSAKYAERENILTWDGSLLVCPVVGEDDISILFS